MRQLIVLALAVVFSVGLLIGAGWFGYRGALALPAITPALFFGLACAAGGGTVHAVAAYATGRTADGRGIVLFACLATAALLGALALVAVPALRAALGWLRGCSIISPRRKATACSSRKRICIGHCTP